jgi:hypothetical protein
VKAEHVARALAEAVEALGVRVRYDRGAFRGGRARVGDEEVVVLNRRLPVETHVMVLAEALRELPADGLYLRPAVRAALEDAWAAADAGQSADAPDVTEA